MYKVFFQVLIVKNSSINGKSWLDENRKLPWEMASFLMRLVDNVVNGSMLLSHSKRTFFR